MRTYLSTKCLIYFGATCNLAFISDWALVVRLSAFLHRLFAQWGEPPCGAEPRIELGPALQQTDALPTEPRRTITEPRRTILSHAAPYWVTPHHNEPRRTILSHAAPYWATPHHTEPRRTILSHAAPYWATPHHKIFRDQQGAFSFPALQFSRGELHFD
jgi:hypothetical protein